MHAAYAFRSNESLPIFNSFAIEARAFLVAVKCVVARLYHIAMISTDARAKRRKRNEMFSGVSAKLLNPNKRRHRQSNSSRCPMKSNCSLRRGYLLTFLVCFEVSRQCAKAKLIVISDAEWMTERERNPTFRFNWKHVIIIHLEAALFHSHKYKIEKPINKTRQAFDFDNSIYKLKIANAREQQKTPKMARNYNRLRHSGAFGWFIHFELMRSIKLAANFRCIWVRYRQRTCFMVSSATECLCACRDLIELSVH